MEIKVVSPGMMTTVQDLGRRGIRSTGFTEGGGMDKFALRLANMLVGNASNETALEITLTGPELEFCHDAVVAVTGAEIAGAPYAHPLRITAGARLKLGAMTRGCRAYLAVGGGLVINRVLQGAGTDLRSGLGGHEGRALQSGDVLTSKGVARNIETHWKLSPSLFPEYGVAPTVRAIPGAEMDEFPDSFWGQEYKIGADSDRMGYRLEGGRLKRKSVRELISLGVVPGTVQVPPEGDPIVLMADAQTIGGYPRIAHVAQVDLPLLAQLRPGNHVQFAKINLAEAQSLMIKREQDLRMLELALGNKVR